MRKVIIASHGSLSTGLKSSAQLIVGDMALDIVTYELLEGMSATDFASEIEEKFVGEYEEVVILTDLFGASVFNSMIPLTRYENVKLFAGVNLGLLLDILLNPESLVDARIAESVETARSMLVHFAGVHELDEEEEDF